MLIVLNKPFGVLSQFSSENGKQNLSDFVDVAGVYPAGRLDFDSEGLIVLTDDGPLQHRIAHPDVGLSKRYWAQVEGLIDDRALNQLRHGITMDGSRTAPATALRLDQMPALWERQPPIRTRAAIPTSWVEIVIKEGKNRQVRRMTAATGFPTLRLIRVGIGSFDLFASGLAPGAWRAIEPGELDVALAAPVRPRTERSAPRKLYRTLRNRSASNKS